MTDLATAGVPLTRACRLVGVARASYYRRVRGYRHYQPVADPVPQADRYQPAALSQAERDQVLDVLTDPDYEDLSVVASYWAAFDAGRLACSQRTFYRVAQANGLVKDRRRVRRPGTGGGRKAPAVAAAGVGDLWSWDVTELAGPARQRYQLYLAIDVFSRYPVAWRIEHDQCRFKTVEMFTQAIAVHGAPRTLHADNGSIQRAGDTITALTNLGVLTSFSRPRVSDDNPFSESLFKTIKYDLSCPERFTDIEHARTWTAAFLHRYATAHRHSALGRHTPQQVHDGTAAQVQATRQARLDTYWQAHPERFRKPPQAPPLPKPTGINTHLLSQTG
ncbi:Integrase core domain-containing protein [Raineyella antarctica]|uniref:Integrase core domain-containing protein n=1 Tax=Raineyella antarctica TaxID=1577474 RepID=A0A1G6GFL2_9ACTN|nr:DDE-type integrase/transposase/recombinase [Raineyella antarctica]SDB80613.1 Integrase core domain-containing protein [Raineyella antarctica]